MGISQFSFLTLTNAADLPIGTVVFTGITIVFFVLILLYLLISIEGVIFRNIENKKKKENDIVKTSSVDNSVVKAPVVAKQQKANIAKTDDGSISGEVIAAITAAISCMQEADGTNYTISSVKRVKMPKQSAWANSAAVAYTEPF